MSKRIEWGGGECPVDGETMAFVYFRDGSVKEDIAKYLDWEHNRERDDIVAYRVLDDGKQPPQKTLLDEFAMAALTGMLSPDGNGFSMMDEFHAEASYKLAEAMMAEKAKREAK